MIHSHQSIDDRMVTLFRKNRAVHSPVGALLLAAAVASSTTGCGGATGDGELTSTRDDALRDLPSPPHPLPDILWQISAGANHTCVRRLVSGNVYCWGMSAYGQAGASSTTCVSAVSCVKRPSFVGITAKQIDLGADHSCAVDMSGNGLCWGANHSGQLGNGSRTITPNLPGSAQPISSGGAPLAFSMISAGSGSTCGLLSGSGSVSCWGLMGPGAWATGAGNPTPSLLRNQWGIVLDAITSVATGSFTSCIQWLRTNGTGTDNSCWTGATAAGLSTFFSPWTSDTTRVANQSGFVCADQRNGTVQCFGGDSDGQLGDGPVDSTSASTVVTVGGGMQLHGVTTGQAHACALDPSNHAYCWGAGMWGQLGQQTASVGPSSSPSPVAVAAFNSSGAPIAFRALAAGESHTCGIGDDDHVYCWGSDGYGQIGTGTWNSLTMPVTQALDPM